MQIPWLRAARQNGTLEKLGDDQLAAPFLSLDPLEAAKCMGTWAAS